MGGSYLLALGNLKMRTTNKVIHVATFKLVYTNFTKSDINNGIRVEMTYGTAKVFGPQ